MPASTFNHEFDTNDKLNVFVPRLRTACRTLTGRCVGWSVCVSESKMFRITGSEATELDFCLISVTTQSI
ncbi:hypothetical protein PI124_g7729 [Phytophthora idaei]|nr:hypothetical protein PI124_g7729 [Phytophthora idaei]